MLVVVAAFALMASVGVSLACQVPVFRFALERWVADPYRVTIMPGASGEFSDAERAAMEFLEARRFSPIRSGESGIAANLDLVVAESPAAGTVEGTMTVSYPEKIPGFQAKPIWTGPLTMENARKLVDSPARRELVKRLLSGESAVWLVVESGDAEADEAAIATVSEAIGQAKEALSIPDGVVTRQEAESAPDLAVMNHDDILRSEVPLKIDFSVMRLARNDPDEALFLPMVLNIEDDLGEFAGETMVFPVFGRGRLLEPLVGRGISGDNVMEYGAYLCGACSCEVKDQNPGLDLLFTADWDAALAGSEVVIEKILPPLEGTGILAQADGEMPTEPETNEPAAGETETRTVVPVTLILGLAGALVVVLGFGTFLILRRQSS